MRNYVIKRILQQVPLLIGLSLLTFLLIWLAPGDAAGRRLRSHGMAVTEELVEQEREALGLNNSFFRQYTDWLAGAVHGDLGSSYKDGMAVAPKVTGAMKYTLVLTAGSLGCALIIAVPAGVWAAVRRGRISDHIIRFAAFFGNSVPNFLLGIMLMYLFCIRLGWFSVISDGSIRGMVLPVLSMAIPLSGRFIRQIRAGMLKELGKPYMTGAAVRGVTRQRRLYGNALHNCLISIVTMIGVSAGTLMGGSVVIETIYGLPGAGRLVMDAISDRDYPVIQGFVVVMALIYAGIQLITDISYRYLDPRTER